MFNNIHKLIKTLAEPCEGSDVKSETSELNKGNTRIEKNGKDNPETEKTEIESFAAQRELKSKTVAELKDDNGNSVSAAVKNRTFSKFGVECKTDDNGKIYSMGGKLFPNHSYRLDGHDYKTDDNGDIYSMDDKPYLEIRFKCPDGVEQKEFNRQLKGQERGLNRQSLAENIENRKRYALEGRSKEGNEAQSITRKKAEASRISSNLKEGMTVSDAREEAKEWIKTQAALHNPDQIAGGNPTKVYRMGDSRVNSSIGSQWRERVKQLDKCTKDYIAEHPQADLTKIKMNVKLIAER